MLLIRATTMTYIPFSVQLNWGYGVQYNLTCILTASAVSCWACEFKHRREREIKSYFSPRSGIPHHITLRIFVSNDCLHTVKLCQVLLTLLQFLLIICLHTVKPSQVLLSNSILIQYSWFVCTQSNCVKYYDLTLLQFLLPSHLGL